MLVEAWLPRAARARPDHPAVQTPDGTWTYGQLHGLAADGAAWLARQGAGPGDRVAIALAPGLAFAQALHACLLAGAIAVPIDVRLRPEEAAQLAAGMLVVDVPLWEGPTKATPPTAPAVHDLDAPAVIIHTSGTSADPRPVELTYGNLLWNALGSAVALGLDPDERWLCAMPLSHVGGLSILVRSAVYGTTAVVHERFETDRVAHALRHDGITLTSVVATTLTRLLDAGLADPPRLRCALAGGGPVAPALLRRAAQAGITVSQTYGLTESCSQATTVPIAAVKRGGGRDELSAGPPLFCTKVTIADDGEILLAGPTLARDSIGDDGWLATGDVGRVDERGWLHVTGRKTDTIITGGENVAPAEVEAVLEAHPAVLEAAVVARADPRWGEAVTAVVVAREGLALDPEEVRAHCATALAAYKVPRVVLVASEPLPRTRSGKLLRRMVSGT